MAKGDFDFKDIIAYIIATIFVIQIISLLITQVFSSIPIIKLGVGIFISLILIIVIFLFYIVTGKFSLDNKTIFIMLLIVALTIFAIVKLPDVLPQIFSIQPDIFKQAIIEIKSIIPFLS